MCCRLLQLQSDPPARLHAVHPSSNSSRTFTAVLQSVQGPSRPICRQPRSSVQTNVLQPIMAISINIIISSSSSAFIRGAMGPVQPSRQGLSMLRHKLRHLCLTVKGHGKRHTLSVLDPVAFANRPRLTLTPSAAAASRLLAFRRQAQIGSSGPGSIR